MFLRNWWELHRCLSVYNLFGPGSSGTTVVSTSYGFPCSMVSIDNTAFHNLTSAGWANFNYSAAYNNALRAHANPFQFANMRIGSGSTEVQSTDITLDQDITSQMSNYSFSKNFGLTNTGSYQAIFSGSFTNNTNDDVVIREVGITGQFGDLINSASSPSTTNNLITRTVLLAREVLDEPIIISAGATKIISVELTMN